MDKLRWLLEARFARASAIGARTLTADWSVSMGGLIGALIGFLTPPAPCHAGHCVLAFCLAAVKSSVFSRDRLGGVLVVSLNEASPSLAQVPCRTTAQAASESRRLQSVSAASLECVSRGCSSRLAAKHQY